MVKLELQSMGSCDRGLNERNIICCKYFIIAVYVNLKPQRDF